MTTLQVINEVVSVISAVISVIARSVLKVLPVLVVMLIGLAAMDVFVGAVFEEEAHTEMPFLSDREPSEIQLGSTVAVNRRAVSPE